MSLVHVERWLAQRLSALAPVAVHVAPPDLPFPHIVLTPVSALDVYNLGLDRLVTECRYQVLVVVRGASAVPAEPLADQVDAVLHGASDPAAGIVVCRRDRALSLADRSEAEEYRLLGGEYVIVAMGS